jgi:hypothetical protein
VLIIPPGHAQELQTLRRLGVRERWLVRFAGVLAAALIAVAVIAITTNGHHSANGCVDVTVPYSTGGQEIYDCGAAARGLCREVGRPQGFNGAVGQTVAAECRKAGVPVG